MATSIVQKFGMKPCTVDSVLLEFEYTKLTNRLPLASLEEYEDSGTTQKEDVKKTPAKVLPSTRSKHCMCTICM